MTQLQELLIFVVVWLACSFLVWLMIRLDKNSCPGDATEMGLFVILGPVFLIMLTLKTAVKLIGKTLK